MNRPHLTRRVKPSLFIAPVSVRRYRRRCPSPTALLSPPTAPLPSSIQVKTDPALLLRLATAHHEWLPQPPPDPVPILPPFLLRKGPFDAATCSAATTEHPLITNQRDGCPYCFTSYRDYKHSLVDTPFGLQVHHPKLLEWVGAPEYARLLGRPLTEWIRVTPAAAPSLFIAPVSVRRHRTPVAA